LGTCLGIVNKLFALPWKTFEFHATEYKLILNVDKEKLKTAPVFDKDTQWPDFSDTLWGRSIYDYAPLDFVGSTIRSACQTDPVDRPRPTMPGFIAPTTFERKGELTWLKN
jgi:hypothetical protein